MPGSRGRQDMTPVIVERRPAYATTANIAPSTPSPPGSPKAVRFAPTIALTSSSRPLTSTEAWSLWHFEDHARRCPQCNDPLGLHLSGGRLCNNGHALAQDVAIHVYHKAGEVYSTERVDHKHVRVELPPNYDRVRDLLKGMDRHLKSASRTVPIISYDRTYPVSPRAPSPTRYAEERNEVIIEPEVTERKPSTKRKTKRKPSGYRTTVVQDHDSEPEAARNAKTRERRGSLYYSDRQRKSKDYHVEVREPEREHRKRDDRRHGGFWN